MAKKKSKQSPPVSEDPSLAGGGPSSPASPAEAPTSSAPTVQGGKKRAATAKAAPIEPSSPSLIICRNKHWRYISAFHGPWLQMPVEILETIANVNYNTARPRPVDPASLFDLVKVRRLVDEATTLAVRAASGIAAPTLTNVHGGFSNTGSMDSLGLGGSGHGAKLSRERMFRMREQASQKLARAYRLDEIACSVATMQGASPLEEVGSSVLQRNAKDPDAKYVHFFHEKIPSRQLAETTSLQPLTDIIQDRPTEPEVLRTRATVRLFKEDYEMASQDLTRALSVCRFHRPSHKLGQEEELQLQEPQRAKRRPQDVVLTEKDQPSSLEGQLLFHRGSVYLAMACQHVAGGIPPKSDHQEPRSSDDNAKYHADEAANHGNPSNPDHEENKRQVESRKAVKILAKRALRDFMAFISQFEYSPDLPVILVKEFNDRVTMAVQRSRNPRHPDTSTAVEPHTVYSLGDLFAAVPPPNLPPYPSQELAKNGPGPSSPASTCEATTYHPLLSDALHSLLLCHCLAQTSPKELERHAYMVARLIRLSDGYPVFQASRSPSRSDWIEVLRKANNWLNLSSSWEDLCAPAPIPIYDYPTDPHSSPSPELAASAAAALINGEAPQAVAAEMRKGRVREQAIMEALDDERVTDEASFRAAILARERRAEEDHDAIVRTAADGPHANGHVNHSQEQQRRHSQSPLEPSSMRRWSAEDAREYPILTERASAISQWVLEAPIVTGTAKRKKRPKKSGNTDGIEAGVGKLDVEESTEV